jgi:hypothetical protein
MLSMMVVTATDDNTVTIDELMMILTMIGMATYDTSVSINDDWCKRNRYCVRTDERW